MNTNKQVSHSKQESISVIFTHPSPSPSFSQRKALDNIDLNQMSHRFVSGVLQNDWNDPSTFAHLIDRSEDILFELVWVIKWSIAGFQCHAIQNGSNKNQNRSRIWEIKGGTYTKTLAKIQDRGIFRIRDIRRNVLPKLIEICMETPCWCSPGWAPT